MAQYIIPALAAIIVAVVEAIAARERKHTKDDRETRQKEFRLSTDMILAISEQCDVLCNALQGGKSNGNVEEARKKAKAAREAYTDFLRDQAASKVAR